ncbi:MAG: hypothetical protein K2M47_00385 [Clostridiales bacterium]|nr:hypothetical protein [Clostridiales bacterium]
MKFAQWAQQQAVAYTVYIIALAAMAALLAVIVAKLFIVGTKNDKLEFLKNYKKGPFAIIYFIAIPLYFLGWLHVSTDIRVGADVLSCFLKSVYRAFSLIKFDFGMDGIVGAMKDDHLYYATMCCCYAVTVINVLMFSASLVWQRFKNLCKKLCAKCSKNLYIVVGCNEHNIMLLKSLKKSKNKAGKGMMLAKPNADMRDKLYLNGICYSSFDSANSSEDELYKKLKSLLGFKYRLGLHTKKKITVIINTEDDERNLLYVKALNKLLLVDTHIKPQIDNNQTDDKHPENGQVKDNKNNDKDAQTNVMRYVDVPVNAKHTRLTGYAFCNVENQSAFAEQIEYAHGHIELLNRYEQIAVEFVDKYPLTRYMTDKHIDYNSGLIKDDVDINVCLIGFGPTNRQVFLRTIGDSQFFTKGKNGIEHKKVHYYVYDKAAAYKDKNLNQTYFRYSREFYKEYLKRQKDGKKTSVDKDFLPLPDYPADDWYNPEFADEWYDAEFNDITKDSKHFKEHFCISDINSYDFYDSLKKVVCKGNSYTYIIVAFGEDLENIDLSQKITARLEMWGKSNGAYVFAKVRSDDLVDKEPDGVKTFGTTGSVYNIDGILNHIKDLALFKSFTYARGITAENKDVGEKAVREWMRMGHTQRQSNLYCCLNLRTKLNLLGLDYVPKTKEDANGGHKEFYKKYFGTDADAEIEDKRYQLTRDCDKSIYCEDSVRTLFAMQEHQRWNANYICSGVIPSCRGDIERGCGKDMKKRLVHDNLTTFAGLDEYYRLRNSEVRHYDYKIMNFADKILFDAGYKIVTKQEREDWENAQKAKAAEK